MKYRVNEIFYSLQGEGVNAGRAAVFVRLSGCNLKCPFCDTNFKDNTIMDADDIINAIGKAIGNNSLPSLCVITGGEPTLQLGYPLDELVDVLHHAGMQVCIETNGTRPMPDTIDFVTVSPKSPYIENAECTIKKCTEVKVIMTDNISVEEIRSFEQIEADYYFVQPCDVGFLEPNRKNMQRCVEFVKSHPNWRLSLQQQKILNVR